MDEKQKQEAATIQRLIIEVDGLTERNKFLEMENKQLSRSNILLSIGCIAYALLWVLSKFLG